MGLVPLEEETPGSSLVLSTVDRGEGTGPHQTLNLPAP